MQSLRDCWGVLYRFFGRTALAWLIAHLSAQAALAGAWPTPTGKGQVISTVLSSKASQAFDSTGKLNSPAQFSKFASSLYLEHGVSKDLTLILSTRFESLAFIAGADEVRFTGLGDTTIGFQKTVLRGKNAILSAQAKIIFAVPGETIADADLGFGTTHFEGRVLVGRSFKLAGRDGFVDGQAAWRIRPDNAPDEWSVDATLGWRARKNILLLGQSFFTNGSGAAGIARNNQRLKLQTSLVYDRSQAMSFQLGFFSTVAGKNIVSETGFIASIWRRY